jgi:hypothetical protein
MFSVKTTFDLLFKGTVTRDFRPAVFSLNGFVFAEIIASKVVKIGFSGFNNHGENENGLVFRNCFCWK